MADGGYGIYSGIGGAPYTVGAVAANPFGSPTAQNGVDAPLGSPIAKPAQEQTSPGAAGADVYASQLPQWMNDYFDKYGAGHGLDSIMTERDLLMNKLPSLVQKYGQTAAYNPYFTSQATAGKGFDPFNNSIYTKNVESGRFQEYNPWFTYNKTTTQKRDPFSGDVQDTQVQYDQTYGPSYDSGQNGGSWSNAAKMGALGYAVMGPVGGAYGAYQGIKKGKWH